MGRRIETVKMFRGNSLAKIDSKGRLKLPAAYRTVIEPKFGKEFFVTTLRARSVRVYPMDFWLEFERKLASMPSMDPTVIKVRNIVNFYGQTATMDAQGRILLHPLVRAKVGLDGEVAVLGQEDHLAVCTRTAFENQLEEDPLSDDDLRKLADLERE
jgi:MraZ protein